MVVSKLVYKDYYTKISILCYFTKVFKFFYKLIFMAEYLAQYSLDLRIHGWFTRSKEKEEYKFSAINGEDVKDKAEDYRIKKLKEVYLPGSLMTLDKILEVKEIKL